MKKFLNWFRRGSWTSSLDRELKYHFDRRVSDLVQSGPGRSVRPKGRPGRK